MDTVTMEKKVLPTILPHGWKTEIAKLLDVHINTITNNLKLGKGLMYEKIMHLAKEKYGITKQENNKNHE